MFEVFKGKDYKYKKVPQWAQVFSLRDFNKFISCIESNFENNKINMKIDEGVIEVPEIFGDNHVLGLSNLAGICYQQNRETWEKVIKQHFDNLIKGHEFNKKFQNSINDLTAISKYITLRVWPKSYVKSGDNDKIIYREYIKDLATTLTFDLPTTVRAISIDEIQNWNVNLDTLFEIGLSNVINNYPVEISVNNINEKPCYVFSGNHFFVATHALILKKYSECVGSYGSIVSFPHRHVMIAYPISGQDVIKAIDTIIKVTAGMYKEGPGPLSSNVYWYIDDKYIKLPYKIEENLIHLYPPDSYMKMLQQIIQNKES